MVSYLKYIESEGYVWVPTWSWQQSSVQSAPRASDVSRTLYFHHWSVPFPHTVCHALPQVVQQGDAWYCEHDGKTYETRERRYIMRLKAADNSGECFLHLFNDQVRV